MGAKFHRRPSSLLRIHKSETAVRMAVDVAGFFLLFEDEAEREKQLEAARVGSLALLALGGGSKQPEVTWENVEEY